MISDKNRRIRLRLEEQYRLIEFSDLGDERGNLVVIEGEGMDIPFDIKRVFYIYGSDSTCLLYSTP
ncbi:MAG: FdtA/QdtA family cupin domain-containing protein, partial [Acetatifactor sp.]|nr:FdtA/QdtA family cupin domain-containing protein [Acetatifactor sp.]